MARRSATKARTQTINQLHALVVTAPDQVKHQLGELSPKARVKVCAAFRPGTAQTTIAYAKKTLRLLARRYQTLTAEIQRTRHRNPDLSAPGPTRRCSPPRGVGPDTAAALCWSQQVTTPSACAQKRPSPPCAEQVPSKSSSRRTAPAQPGNRQANNALWHRLTTRMATRQPSTHRRQAEATTALCLKRHIAHHPTNAPDPPQRHLRIRRQTSPNRKPQNYTHPTLLSQLERGLYHNHHLATQYRNWLTQQPI